MSQRKSGYIRHDHDIYNTPAWVTEVLLPYLPPVPIWEPAAGEGKMVRALRDGGHKVCASDISRGADFLKMPFDGRGIMSIADAGVRAIVTNPPYSLATRFIEHALELMKPVDGMVAMLLRTDFDHAKTRQHLFGHNDAFDIKIELTKRIRWIEGSTGAPSYNHSWFIWDWLRGGLPKIRYAP